MVEKQVRVGIIGYGNMGKSHASNIENGLILSCCLTAVCDSSTERLNLAKSEHPKAALFDSYMRLIKSGLVDAILISTPHYSHPEIALAAFEAGLHVLTEKPAGVRTGDVRLMNLGAKQSGKIFGIMFNQRTNPLYAKAREIVKSGGIGKPKRLVWIITNWYRSQCYYNSGGWRGTWLGEGGGVLLNQAPHNLDIWQWIFGMPNRVYATCNEGKHHNIDVEDDATIFAEYENGATAVFITSTGEYPGTNRLEISGDKGKLLLEDGKMKFTKLGESERTFCFSSEDYFPQIPFETEEVLPEEIETAHIGIFNDFIHAILVYEESGIDEVTMLSPGEEGINALEISNAAYLSSWTGERVDLPLSEWDERRFNWLLEGKIKNEDENRDNKLGRQERSSSEDATQSPRWHVKW